MPLLQFAVSYSLNQPNKLHVPYCFKENKIKMWW